MKKILIAIILIVLAIALSQPVFVSGNSTVQDDGPRLFNRYLPLVMGTYRSEWPYPPPW